MDNEDKLTRLDNTSADDLTQIKGITKKSANILKEADINTFAKLAAYETAEQLQSEVNTKTGQEIDIWRIENKGQPYGSWMQQASELAPPEKAANGASSAKDTKEAPEKWKQHKIVKICTVELGFNGETDEQGRLVPKVSLYREDFGDGPTHRFDDYNKWVGWIAEEVDWPVPELVAAKEPTLLEIRDVGLSEVGPSSDVPEKRLMAEVRFKLSGTEAETRMAERLPYRVEIHTFDLNSKEVNLVASGRGELKPQVFEYVSQQRFPIPKTGRYEIYSIVLFLPPGSVAAYHHGPIINIVP
mgnify:FL=1